MKKRSKKYRPKPIAQEGGLLALNRIQARGENASPLADDQLTDIGTGYWLALTNLTTGTGSEESWCTLVCALNIGMVLAEQGIGAVYVDAFVAALDGAFRAKQRSKGTFRLDGDGLQAVRAALEIHDEQVKVAQRRELVQAMQTVRERIDSGNVYTD